MRASKVEGRDRLEKIGFHFILSVTGLKITLGDIVPLYVIFSQGLFLLFEIHSRVDHACLVSIPYYHMFRLPVSAIIM
jgi:hypothetical protein